MTTNAFFVQNGTFITFLIYFERCIHKEWYPVAGIQPEDPVTHFTFLHGKMRFAYRIVLIIANPFQNAWRLCRYGYKSP
ncbi:hypothetical protein D3C74_387190 [compost metagenome]